MNEQLLLAHLATAVPLRIHELRDQPDWALEDTRGEVRERLRTGADVAMFGEGKQDEAAAAIGAWTTALALLALQAQGGVDFHGLHWCATPGCRTGSRFDHADADESAAPPG